MLKEKIKKWLFKDELHRIEVLEKAYKDQVQWCENRADEFYRQAVMAEKKAKMAISLADNCRETMSRICEVGTDVGFHEYHSWAVICINGNKEYVKFMPLENRDAKSVLEFLKQFQYAKHTIDSPLAFRDMVKNELLN